MLPNLKAERILIVEDELSIADRLAQLLRLKGFEAHNAYNCGDALAADHGRYRMALVDGGMRDRGGRSVFDYIGNSPTFSRLHFVTINREGITGVNFFPLKYPEDEADLIRYVELYIRNPQAASQEMITSRPVSRPRTDDTVVEVPRRQQLAAFKTLSDLGRSISSELDLTLVLNKIVEAATALTRAEEGLLLLPDEDGKTLYLRAMKGLDDENARNFRIRNQNGAVGQVFQTGKSVLVSDNGPLQIRTQYFVKSLLYVPMVYKNTVIGVLGVNNKRVNRAFSLNDQELLLDLAAHAAIAIENARLYEERTQQNRQLSILVESAKAVNSTLSLGDVLKGICEQLIQALNLSVVQILQRHPGNTFQAMAQTWRAIWTLENAPRGRLDDRPMLRQALEQGAFYKVTQEYHAKKWLQERAILDEEGASEMLLLAIKPPVGAKLTGSKPPMGFVELFYRRQPPEVTQEFRHRIRGNIYEVAEVIAAQPSLLPIHALYEAADVILANAEADWLKLWLTTTDGTLLRVMEYGTAVYLTEPFPQALQEAPCQSVLRDTSKTASLDHRDGALSETTRLYMSNLGAKSMLCVPMNVKGALFGVVAAYDTLEPRYRRPEDMRLLQGLVTQAATAIDNARLYFDLQRSMDNLKQAQAKLVETARLSAIGELAAVVAHQIHNPLTTVIADAELLLRDLEADHPMHAGVAAIHRAGKRSSAVVKRLLSTARREPGEKPHTLNLNDTISGTLELVMVYIERKGIVVDVQLDPTPVYVRAKIGHLEDVWLNLLMNAHDALDGVEAARIMLSSRLVDGEIEVTVHDNGPGVPTEYQEHIFNPFFTTKPVGEGTGLGLYICKQISEECHGRIILDTTVPQGACFRVNIPLAEPESFAT